MEEIWVESIRGRGFKFLLFITLDKGIDSKEENTERHTGSLEKAAALHPKEPLENHLLLTSVFLIWTSLPSFNHFDFTQSGRRILGDWPDGFGKNGVQRQGLARCAGAVKKIP
jgi:hypothetical protein